VKLYATEEGRYIGRMLRLRRLAGLVGSVLCLLALLTPRLARAQASAFLPVDDNAYTYLDALIARGRLWRLSALERPYRVGDIKRALSADTAPASTAIRRLERQLAAALVKYDASDVPGVKPDEDALRIAVTPYVFLTQQTSGVRDLMHADSTSHVRPGVGGVAIVQMGNLVVGARADEDTRLKDDPQYLGQKNRWYVGRMEDAYIDGQYTYAELFVGRMGRNWGPSQSTGLLIGDYVYTYDQAYMKLGVPALNLSGMVTRLDDGFLTTGSTVDTAERYLGVHKLATHLGTFEASFSESVVYGGTGQGFRPAYMNPVTPFILSEVSDNNPGNILEAVDGSWRSPFGQFAGQFLLDDVSKDKCVPNCQKPNSYGYTLQAEGVPLFGDQRLYGSYTRVANLTYRNETWYDTYTYQDVSLGAGYSDYDELRGGLDLLLPFGLPLRVYGAYQRQGEGNYLEPHPLPAQYDSTAQFLQGIVQRTTRAAVSGSAMLGRFVRITGDMGVNHVVNSQHVTGATVTSFVGRVQVTIDSPWLLAAGLRPE